MEEFRVSQEFLKFQRRYALLMIPVVWLVPILLAYLGRSTGLVRAVVFATAVGCISMYALWRSYRRELVRAEQTTLVLGSVAMIVREGSVETRFQYGAIELLALRKPLLGDAWLLVKLEDGAEVRLYGYSDMPRLMSLLSQKVPKERQRGFP
jgi:hypothetical protein